MFHMYMESFHSILHFVARWTGVQNPPCNTKQKTDPPDNQSLLNLMLSHLSAQAAKSGSSMVALTLPARTGVVPEPVEPEIEMGVDPTVIQPAVRIESAPQAFSLSSGSENASVPAPQQLRIIEAEIDSDIKILDHEKPLAQDPAPPQPVPSMSEYEARRLQELFTKLNLF
ncbi:hypothetical protein CAEBREN_25260 [Caenorhabditis brenneri]|uniref:Uncharacterized protein n=1 Tax=Caenorhabditis brenneri TaxID=135651 RepID=G0P1V3_CAEBE|nr:hypothetical protein CAEBREN_25260 [Caenorhabditis brenneri]